MVNRNWTLMDALNLQLFAWIHQGSGQQPLLDALAIFFSETGPYLLMGALVLLWFVANDQRRSTLLESTEAAAFGLMLNQLLGLVYFHPRPYMLGLAQPLIVHAPENSFPSDHATLMLTAAFYLICRTDWRRPGLLLLIFALATAWGRVYAGIHFPFDILGSLLVSVASLTLVFRLRSRLEPLNRFLVRTYHQLIQRLGFRAADKPAA